MSIIMWTVVVSVWMFNQGQSSGYDAGCLAGRASIYRDAVRVGCGEFCTKSTDKHGNPQMLFRWKCEP
jgi:hypothetical protein